MNGLGACATQYASEYMDVYSYDGERVSEIHFKKGEVDRELTVRDLERRERRTGTVTRWRPDLEVFTDIAIPRDYYTLILEKQAVVNAGLKFERGRHVRSVRDTVSERHIRLYRKRGRRYGADGDRPLDDGDIGKGPRG